MMGSAGVLPGIAVSARRLLIEGLELVAGTAGVPAGWRLRLVEAHDLPARLAADPDVGVVIDLDAPGGALEHVREARAASPSGDWIGICDRLTPQHAQTAFELGLVAIVHTTDPIATIRAIMHGEHEASSSHRSVGLRSVAPDVLDRLAPLELEVLRAAARSEDGTSPLSELAPTTIARHRRSVVRKLGVRDLREAVNVYIRADSLRRG
jgi:DNA-binding NarL/FixJ family response regulator